MLLKNHLIEIFNKASSENNILLKEKIVLKWVHRFGIDSLNDLLIHNQEQREYHHEKENQEQIKLKLSKTFEKIGETNSELNEVESSSSNVISSKNQNSNNIQDLKDFQNLPLPNIKNLRKWIKNDKKAS